MSQDAHSRVPLVKGTQPGLTIETQSLLRERLRAVALVLTIGAGIFLIRSFFTGDGALRWLRLPIFFLLLGSYLLLRTSRPLRLVHLRLCELAVFGLVGVQLVMFQTVSTRDFMEQALPAKVMDVTLFGFMAWMFLVMMYGIFIPNTWKRAAIVVSSAALIPVVLTLTLSLSITGVSETIDLQALFAAALLLLLAVIASVYGTFVVNTLRKEIFKAKQYGQYTLEKRIGGGGMGQVYRAKHVMLRRPTAIKLIRPDQQGEENLQRFEREVQLTSQLTHPNTIAIYDYGRTPEGVFYYAMEYLGDGLDLETLVKKTGPQPPARVIHILEQVCGSLYEAHERGMVHRDVKPANIILCQRGGVRDVVKVIDFGLVKDVEHQIDPGVTL